MNDAGKFGPARARSRQVLMLILVAGMSIAAYLAYNVWDRIQALDSAQQHGQAVRGDALGAEHRGRERR